MFCEEQFLEGSSFIKQKMLSSEGHPNCRAVGNYNLFTNEVLGKGATGSVYKGIHKMSLQPVAIKAIDLASICDEATRSLLDNEKEGLRSIKAPNVLKLEDIIEDSRFCYIVTELCEGTTLKEYLRDKQQLSEEEAMAIFRKLSAGSLAMAQECMIHRDLKPANVMVSKTGEVKIIDLGYCEIIRAKKVMKTFNVGSPSYMSPEAYLRTLYSEKSDAWSLGIILYELLHGCTLDQGQDIKRYFEDIKADPLFVSKKISPSISSPVRQIIEKALKINTEERSSINNLKYLADRYHVNLRQKNQNAGYSSVQPTPTVVRQTPKVHFQEMPTTSLRRVDSENKSLTGGFSGYSSFREFRQSTRPEEEGGNLMRMKQLTSLEDFDASSIKADSNKSRGVAMNDKLNKFLQMTVKQARPLRPGTQGNIPEMCRTTVVSSRELHFIPLNPLPMMRHQTVRFN